VKCRYEFRAYFFRVFGFREPTYSSTLVHEFYILSSLHFYCL
jgi:hypothetical protein